MSNMIASCCCLVVKPDGDASQFTLGVSQPVQQPTGEYGCDTFLPDTDQPRTIYGEDSLQSLLLALKFMADRINDLLSRQWKFEYEESGQTTRVPFEAYFMHPEWIASLKEIGDQGQQALQNKSE